MNKAEAGGLQVQRQSGLYTKTLFKIKGYKHTHPATLWWINPKVF
jgi:hypothetical protein